IRLLGIHFFPGRPDTAILDLRASAEIVDLRAGTWQLISPIRDGSNMSGFAGDRVLAVDAKNSRILWGSDASAGMGIARPTLFEGGFDLPGNGQPAKYAQNDVLYLNQYELPIGGNYFENEPRVFVVTGPSIWGDWLNL